MTTMIPTIPDEETPLLIGDQQVSTVGRNESEVATLADPSNQSGRAISIRGGTNSNDESRLDVVKKTPLPWAQLSIVLSILLAEHLTTQVISPFTPELVRSSGVAKSEAEVGYYVGIMYSLPYAAQACTILRWGSLSDHIGRKPIVLIGLFGLWFSMSCFALSTTFWGFVLSRVVGSALDSNLGGIRTIIAELADHTNLALAYSYQPIIGSIGTTLGPLVGGALSHPAERFPSLFGNSKFLKDHPYSLPCVVAGTFAAIVWLVTFFFHKETHSSPKSIREFLRGEKGRVASERESLLTAEAPPQDEPDKPIPLRDLLTRDVIVVSASYSFPALLDVSFRTLQPIFLATPVALGGLELDPPVIGTIMTSFGILNGIVSMFYFPWMVNFVGVKRVHLIGATAAIPCFSLFPVINHLARNSTVEGSGELGVGVWVVVGLQVVMAVLICSCYPAAFIFIAAAAPNKASLGATNGLAQLAASFVRAIGPALASSMYSLSIDEDHHYMGGWLVYYVAVALSLGAIWVGSLLPKHPWKDMN